MTNDIALPKNAFDKALPESGGDMPSIVDSGERALEKAIQTQLVGLLEKQYDMSAIDPVDYFSNRQGNRAIVTLHHGKVAGAILLKNHEADRSGHSHSYEIHRLAVSSLLEKNLSLTISVNMVRKAAEIAKKSNKDLTVDYEISAIGLGVADRSRENRRIQNFYEGSFQKFGMTFKIKDVNQSDSYSCEYWTTRYLRYHQRTL